MSAKASQRPRKRKSEATGVRASGFLSFIGCFAPFLGIRCGLSGPFEARADGPKDLENLQFF